MVWFSYTLTSVIVPGVVALLLTDNGPPRIPAPAAGGARPDKEADRAVVHQPAQAASVLPSSPCSRVMLWLARRMTQMLADVLPGREVHCYRRFRVRREELKKLGVQVTWTT